MKRVRHLLAAMLLALCSLGCEVIEGECRCASAELEVHAECAADFEACVAHSVVQAGRDLQAGGAAAAESRHGRRIDDCGEAWAVCVGAADR